MTAARDENGISWVDGRADVIDPGTPAPDFEVPDHTGRSVRLSDYRGRTVVLWFYPKADTPG